MRETWVRSLGREDPLEKEMVTHSSTLAWRIPWTEKPGRLQSMGSGRKELDTTEQLHFHFSSQKFFVPIPPYIFCRNEFVYFGRPGSLLLRGLCATCVEQGTVVAVHERLTAVASRAERGLWVPWL